MPVLAVCDAPTTAAPPPSWLGVEPRHLAALKAVAEHASLRAAARALGYSQSAISQLIGQLEQTLDVRVLDRGGGLTPPGDVLLAGATSVLDSLAAAQADLAALRRPQPRVAILASLAPRLAPAVLRHDAQVVEVEDGRELATLVARGEVELALGEAPSVPGPFDTRPIGRDPYVLAVPGDWPLADASPRELLERLPSIARSDDPVADHLRLIGVTPLWGARAASDAAALALARAGSGTAILPASLLATDAHVRAIALDDLVPARAICRFVHRDRHLPAAVETIADAVADALRRAGRPRAGFRPDR